MRRAVAVFPGNGFVFSTANGVEPAPGRLLRRTLRPRGKSARL
ncbi:hypothetical protein J2S66_001462 [Saccharothrix longispora]|uniref:Uncharacterized protein n=1 Tax=Saccharothrix longispora TaxID=33920 RepID=A0ABU1PR06_9PSEU|nr:hypothetical protein [Saccharothrix longispora]